MFLQALRRHVGLGQYTAADGDAGPTHGIRIPGNQRMPPGQRSAFGQPSVCTGTGQPGSIPQGSPVYPDAVIHPLLPIEIIGAAASLHVQQPAGHTRVVDLSAVAILQLVQAAAAAAVAESFPLLLAHFLQRAGQPEFFFQIQYRTSVHARSRFSPRGQPP